MFLEEAPEQLPIRVQGIERDWEPGFCAAATGPFPEAAGRFDGGGCEIEWNTAAGTIDLHAAVEDGVLPGCFGFPEGVQADLCVVLSASGEDPAFDVLITIDFAV